MCAYLSRRLLMCVCVLRIFESLTSDKNEKEVVLFPSHSLQIFLCCRFIYVYTLFKTKHTIFFIAVSVIAVCCICFNCCWYCCIRTVIIVHRSTHRYIYISYTWETEWTGDETHTRRDATSTQPN